MPCSIRRIDVAGRDVTEYLQTLLRKSGYVFHTSAEKEVVRQIKEKTGYVALDPRKEEKDWQGTGSKGEGKIVDYKLPDGNVLKVRIRLYGSLTSMDLALSVITPLTHLGITR